MDAATIAKILNENGDIFENDCLRGVMEDYFASGTTNAEEEESNWDEDDSEESRSTSQRAEPMSVSDEEHEEEIDEPVVRIFEDFTPTDGVCNGQLDPAIQEARDWSCNCKTKVMAAVEGDTRRGCVVQFTPEEIKAIHLSIAEMDRGAVDMLVLGLILSCINMSEMANADRPCDRKERQRTRCTYKYVSRPVCVTTFQRLLGRMSKERLQNLQDHFKQNGLVPRKLKSGGRKNNTKALTFDDTDAVRRFLLTYSEAHAVHLPGRVPGFKRDDIQLLPSDRSKAMIYKIYAESIVPGQRTVSHAMFLKLWRQLCPFLVVARSMTDLCWRCQSNNNMIYKGTNCTLEEKRALIAEQQQHLQEVFDEQALYREQSAAAKEAVQALSEGFGKLQRSQPNSRDMSMHYSFDFAQQVHYPHNAAQPGPIYFLTPRKCAIFGICCEGFPQQVNYLVDEAVNTSKGANGVISYLHHFFTEYGLGETKLFLHCDNCSGQNKNRYVLWYFAWRVMRQLHSEVTISFMPPGHTKFAPDWCFGLFKRKFRRSVVSCLDDIATAVRESTHISQTNIPQLVGTQTEEVLVPTLDWANFFEGFRPLVGIKKLYHFRFTSERPGVVFYKAKLADATWQEFQLCRPSADHLAPEPVVLDPPGLPRERREYLHQHIREFIPNTDERALRFSRTTVAALL